MRFARIVVPNCPHHVFHRGNRKEDLFLDDSDRLVYLRLMRDASQRARTSIWTYVLMKNHVHYVAVPHFEDSLNKTIKTAHGEYTNYFNNKYGTVGHAWQGRFKSIPMDEAYCRNAICYVERNPVRAGLVTRAEDFPWSSAAAHCGLSDDMLLSGDCPLTREIADWTEWINHDDDLANFLIRKHTRTGRPLGSFEFLARIEVQAGRSLVPKKPGRRTNDTRLA